MISIWGVLFLSCALFFAILQSSLPLYGYLRGNRYLLASARPALIAQSICILLSFSFLVYGFATNDFTILYIAQNSHPDLPFIYRLTAIWGGA